jgi:hypothetical protein
MAEHFSPAEVADLLESGVAAILNIVSWLATVRMGSDNTEILPVVTVRFRTTCAMVMLATIPAFGKPYRVEAST